MLSTNPRLPLSDDIPALKRELYRLFAEIAIEHNRIETFSSVSKGTTSARPVLTAATTDIGRLYLDTTLDADGKPIWWNGTAWVDATGATV